MKSSTAVALGIGAAVLLGGGGIAYAVMRKGSGLTSAQALAQQQLTLGSRAVAMYQPPPAATPTTGPAAVSSRSFASNAVGTVSTVAGKVSGLTGWAANVAGLGSSYSAAKSTVGAGVSAAKSIVSGLRSLF